MSALVASLFAVGASPAHGDVIGADDSKAEASNKAQFEACVGEALEDQGFTDLGSLEATAVNINCLAYYGITVGKTADTFAPNDNVKRSEMALFLYRAAGLMGVDLMGGDMMADFGDVSELGEDRQNAIKALARNGILDGRGDMGNFYPNADITRAEMAVALVTLLDHTPGAPVHKDKDTGLFELGATADAAAEPGDYFVDARRSTPLHVDNAISAAYELGITSGTGDGNFSPSWSVPRRDMATFIIRALHHSNVRPAGVTAQLAGTKITVSVRDADFAPVVNADVDVFKADAAHESRAFKADGTCTSRATAFEGEGGTKCAIDGADPVTGTDGNVELGDIANQIGDGLTVWAWTGEIGDKFDDDTDVFEFSVPKTAPVLLAVQASHSTDLPKQTDGETPVMRARFGRTVTVTIQLKGDTNADGDDDNVAPADLVDTGRRGEGDKGKYSVSVETFTGTAEQTDATRVKQSSEEVTVDSTGAVSFRVTATDTDPNNGGQTQTVRYTIDPATGSMGFGEGTNANQGSVVFSDMPARPTYMSVSVDGSRVAPGIGATGSNRATVTVLDQYGNPFSGAPIRLFTNDPLPDGETQGSKIRTSSLSTNSRGTVTVGYSYTGGASQEQLVAMWDGYIAPHDADDDGETNPADEGQAGTKGFAEVTAGDTFNPTSGCQNNAAPGADLCAVTYAHWVMTFKGTTTGATGLQVLSLDVDNDQIVYDGPDAGVDPMSVNYDSNDAFVVVSPDGPDQDSTEETDPVSLSAFEEALAKALKDSAANDGQFPTLKVSSYVDDDSTDIASFEVDVTIDQ